PAFGFPDNPIVPFPKGKQFDKYIFTVIYQNSQGAAPKFDVILHIRDNNQPPNAPTTDVKMDPVPPIDYTAGVKYQVQIQAPNSGLTVGAHDITFGFAG